MEHKYLSNIIKSNNLLIIKYFVFLADKYFNQFPLTPKLIKMFLLDRTVEKALNGNKANIFANPCDISTL